MSSPRFAAASAAVLAMVAVAQAQQASPPGVARPALAAEAPVPVSAVAAAKATTVFVDANFGARKSSAAKALSRKHEEMEAQGWRFAHLAPYTENGDLVGFFVTYLR